MKFAYDNTEIVIPKTSVSSFCFVQPDDGLEQADVQHDLGRGCGAIATGQRGPDVARGEWNGSMRYNIS